MSVYIVWPIDPSSACVTAINTLISELSWPRKRYERTPFSCSITLPVRSHGPTVVLAECVHEGALGVFHVTQRISCPNKKHDFTLEKWTTVFTPHSVADCNGVSSGSWGQRTSKANACTHTSTHMFEPHTTHM